MPFYEVFALVKPKLATAQCAEVLRGAATVLLKGGAILTDIKSYGEREIAYKIRRPGAAFDEARTRAGMPGCIAHCAASLGGASRVWRVVQAFMWQMGFMADPRTLKELDHQLKVDERVLRFMVFRKRALPKLPNTYALAKKAKELLTQAGAAA